MSTLCLKEILRDQVAEGSVYKNKTSLMTYSQAPNINDNHGIGLHSHAYCDDIEILIEGKAAPLCGPNQLIELEAPCIIINQPNVPHSVISPVGYHKLIGYRSPATYEGTPYPLHEVTEELWEKQKQQIIKNIDKTEKGVELLYETSLNKVYKYSFTKGNDKKLIFPKGFMIVNILEETASLNNNGERLELKKFEVYQTDHLSILDHIDASNTILILIGPKGY